MVLSNWSLQVRSITRWMGVCRASRTDGQARSTPFREQSHDQHEHHRADNRPDDGKGVAADGNIQKLGQPELRTHPGTEQCSDKTDGDRDQDPPAGRTGDGLSDGPADSGDQEQEDKFENSHNAFAVQIIVLDRSPWQWKQWNENHLAPCCSNRPHFPPACPYFPQMAVVGAFSGVVMAREKEKYASKLTDSSVRGIGGFVKTNEQSAGRPKDETLAERRRREILAEAARLFAETGYPRADLQVLADRLGVGKGTVYRYFSTKEALFLAAVDEGIHGLSEVIDAALEDESDPVRRLEKSVHTYLGYFDRHPEMVELLIIERAEFRDRKKATYFVYKERHHGRRRAIAEEGMASGAFRQMDPERLMRVVSDLLYGVIFTNHFSERRVPFEQQAQEVIDFVLHGIAGRKDHSSD